MSSYSNSSFLCICLYIAKRLVKRPDLPAKYSLRPTRTKPVYKIGSMLPKSMLVTMCSPSAMLTISTSSVAGMHKRTVTATSAITC